MSNIAILGPHEVRICGKKFLYRNDTLYIIRDRESDADYDEDEEWVFDAWCGPPAVDEDILRVWRCHTHPHQPTQPTTQQQLTRWITRTEALTLTISNNGVEFHVMGEAGVWNSEMSNNALITHFTDGAFAGTLEEYLECLKRGVDRTITVDVVVGVGEMKLTMCVYECASGTLHHEFVLQRADVPRNILQLLLCHLPPKHVEEGEVFDDDADTVVEGDESHEAVVCSSATPYIPIHILLGLRRHGSIGANWFKARGGTRV